MRPGAAPRLTVRSTRELARLAALAPEWSALHAAAAGASPFLAPEWLLPWARHLGGGGAPWILEARDAAGALAGLLLLWGRSGRGPRRFRLLGNGVTGADGLDVLARAGDEGAVADALAGALAGGGWDALDLEDVPADRSTAAALAARLATAGARVEVVPRFTCPGFPVQGRFEDHLRRIGRRETYGRRVRWLSRQPGFAIEVITRGAEVGSALEELLRLHRLRWQAEGGSEGIPTGPVEDFHRDAAARLAARGWLRLYRLRVDGRAIAAVYGIEAGRTFFYYQSGYDPTWAARSPGLVLVGRTVEDAYARGLAWYDFLRGEEAYKLDWAEDRRRLAAVRVRAPTLGARVAGALEGAFGAARAVGRTVLPARAWAVLRRARRRRVLGGGPAGGAGAARPQGRAPLA